MVMPNTNLPFMFIPNGIATVEILYYFPDRPLLIAPSLVWQDMDFYPDYPRMMHFLRFWKNEIRATVESVRLTHQLAQSTREFDPRTISSLLN